MNIFVLIGTYLLVSALFVAQPWLSRKNVLFGVVFADDDVWQHAQAAVIRRRYLNEAICTALVLLLILFFLPYFLAKGPLAIVFNCIMVALILIESFVYVLANRRTRILKQTMTPNAKLATDKVIVDVGKSDRETVLSLRWFLILIPLFIATLAVVWFGYPYMADSIPTHFGIAGPDQWAPKSWRSVLSPVFIEVLLGILILLIRRAPASVKGNPNAAPGYAQYRKMMGILLIGFCLMTELLFLLGVISFITPIHSLWYLAISLIDLGFLITLFVLFNRFVRNMRSSGTILDDDAKWIWGLFYFNRSDPSLFVEKRVGIGYTVNMARPIAWIVLIGIIVIAIVFSR
ncbi:DUF5808 domain-containing protein [Sporolactobacillus sp. STCC-11]|uniref:DUF5808 domain-containing protein n=1 Tax=Sporolactobacillus caesalpiniae TaxID=3230362 RepID=UPI003393F11C